MAAATDVTVRAFLIYIGIEDRMELESSPVELPKRGLLFLREGDVKVLFGEPYSGQVIRDWKSTFEKVKTGGRLTDFYRCAQTLPQPLVRLKRL